MSFIVAYSYLRYSSPAQADGDSIRRQTTATVAWCKRNGVPLDVTTSYEDRGRSGFHGRHRQGDGMLARFLADVEGGHIPRGAVLVLENLDRLSRENPWDAVPLLCSIVNAGVAVVTLSPAEVVYQRGRDLTPLVLAVVEFGRGHSESASKSDRLSAVWAEKQRLARDTGAIVTRRLPAWVEEKNGRLVLVPARAVMVRRIFDLAVKGHGLAMIVRRLTEEKVKPWGRGAAWSKAYVYKIIAGRVVLGEYQPRKGAKADGPPVVDYYPACVDLATWEQAQAALESRREAPGRRGEKVASLFTGLAYDATTGGRLLIATQTRGRKANRQYKRVLVSADSMEGRAPSVSFPYDVFEAGILSVLPEVKAADVFGEEPASESSTLSGELARVSQRLRLVTAELVESEEEVPQIAQAARELRQREIDLIRRLAAARQREANPKTAAWSEAQDLMRAAAGDEATRLRLRALLRTTIEAMWVLIVPRGAVRLAAVQVHFAGGGRRVYLLRYRAAGYCRPALNPPPRSKTDAEFTNPAASALDLRQREHAEALERKLRAIPLDSLFS